MVEKTIPCIGIDLGTCNSCVGVFIDGEVVIVPNENGNKTTPSVVSFGAKERKIGEAAKGKAHANAENTVFSAKRLMGLTMTVDELKKKNGETAVELVAGPDEKPDENGQIKPKIEVEFGGKKFQLTPEQISAMILTKMREIAETFTKVQGIRDCVITVPAYFNDAQREATKHAGRAAGLNVVRIVNEPTAAAIAYGIEQKENTASQIFVFDFGGGTLDCTILKIDKTKEDPEYLVQSTSGDCALGGDDFDNVITTFCADKFEEQTGQDVMRSGRAMRRLKAAAEQAKKQLSDAQEAEICIDALAKDADFEYTLTREEFDKICDGLIKKCIPVIDDAMNGAKVLRSDIDEIVLVGGTSRIPAVQEMLKKKFKKANLNFKVNPDEAVAYGATLLCSQMTDRATGHTKVVDVTSLNLGIEVTVAEDDFRMSIMIPKNTQLPYRGKKEYTTVMANQPRIDLRIVEGEAGQGDATTNCTELSKIMLENIPEGPEGEAVIIVTFDINKEGILTATAKDADEINCADIKIEIAKNKGKEQIKEDIAILEVFDDADQHANNNVGAKNAFEKFLADMRAAKNDNDKKKMLTEADMTTLDVCIGLGEDFLNEEPGATAVQYQEKTVEIEEFYSPLLDKMNGDEGDYPDEVEDIEVVEDFPDEIE